MGCLLALALAGTLAASGCSSRAPEESSAAAGASGNAPLQPASGYTAETARAAFDQPRKPEGEIAIQIVTNGISPFWTPMGVGMEHAAKELGCKAEWTGPRDATVAEQKRMVEDALAKGVDGIALSCIEAEASKPIIDLVLSRQVPVITFDSDSPGSARLAYIGTNNVSAGRAAGEAAARLLPNGGKLVAFVGNIAAQNARERRDGFLETARPAGVELVGDPIDDNKDPARARRNVEDAMARYGDEVAGFLGLFSYNGPAIVQAVTSAGRRERYRILCFDAEPVTLAELEKGNIDATVVQKPYEFGRLATRLLYLINRKGWSAAKAEMQIPDDGIYDTGVEVITPANVKAYREGLRKLGITSS